MTILQQLNGMVTASLRREAWDVGRCVAAKVVEGVRLGTSVAAMQRESAPRLRRSFDAASRLPCPRNR